MNYNNSLSLWNFDEYFLKSRLSKLGAASLSREQPSPIGSPTIVDGPVWCEFTSRVLEARGRLVAG